MKKYLLALLLTLICSTAHAQVPVIPVGQATVNGATGNFPLGTAANPLYVSSSTSLTSPVAAGGRLSLSSTQAVMTADVAAATTVYYLPYVSQKVPVWNGTLWTTQDIGGTGVSLTLNSTNMATTKLFDVYLSVQSGTPTLCSLAWGSNTARSTSAGGAGSQNASIVQLNGAYTNNAAIATGNCFNNTTSYVIGQNQGTLLGTFYTTANGQSTFTCLPASAAGGSNNIIGFSNIYNRAPLSCQEIDSNTNWTSTNQTWHVADAAGTGSGLNNRITYVDPLGNINLSTPFTQAAATSVANTDGCQIGTCLNATNCTPAIAPITVWTSSINLLSFMNVYGTLGLNYSQAMEKVVTGGTCSFGLGATYGLQAQGTY